MRHEIETPIGLVSMEFDERSCEVAFLPEHGEADVAVEDGSVTFSIRGKAPSPGREVTQNGSTFEVIDVRRNGDGYDVLNGNTKVWERWLEH